MQWHTLVVDPRTGNRIISAVTAFCIALSVVSVLWWVRTNPARDLTAEVPGLDGFAAAGGAQAALLNLVGVFETFDGTKSSLPGHWPAFRGPDGSNIATGTPLASAWPAEGPKIHWKIPIGDGYAAPAIFEGCVYLMDYDMKKKADALRCISLEDGKEIWRRSYGVNIKRNHGMSRTIPAITKEYIVVMGPKCQVICVDTATGDFRWGIDLQRDYGTAEPLWYTGQCPIIDNGKAIIAPAGKDVLLMGVDCASGEVVWKIPNPDQWNMSHASVIPMTLLGKKMYVYTALGGMVAASAEPGSEGQLMWSIPWDAKVVAPSPVQVSDSEIFCTTGYGRGSRLLKIKADGAAYKAEVVYDKKPEDILCCEQQTPLFFNGLLYGIMPKDAGTYKGQFVCYKPDGTMVWSSGADNRFGLGPFMVADNKFYILDEEGELTMLDATKNEFVKLGHADTLEGHDAWGPLAIAGSRLFVRDLNTLACVELGA